MSTFPEGATILWHIKGAPPPALLPCRAHTCTPLRRGEKCRTFGRNIIIQENRTQMRKYSLSIAAVSFTPTVRLHEKAKSGGLRGLSLPEQQRVSFRALHPAQMRAKAIRNLSFFYLISLVIALQQRMVNGLHLYNTQSFYMGLSFTHSHSHSYTNG